MRYNNYHKHSHYSNPRVQDSICKPEEYMKRAVELGHKTYFTTEHGWAGNIFEAYTLCQKYNLKCIFAVEPYYVDKIKLNDDDVKSRKRYHIMLIAMTEDGRKQINKILSKANTEGFYYQPRIDLECLLSLNPKDVIVTTACINSRLFKPTYKQKIIGYENDKKTGEKIPIYETYEIKDGWLNDFFLPVYKHFGSSLFLEVQDHIDVAQAEYNKKVLELSKEYGVEIIHANDSHYIYPEDAQYRDLYIKGKRKNNNNSNQEEANEEFSEDNFILDYPDYKTIKERYLMQGVLTEKEIEKAVKNTLIFDKSSGIHLDKEFKIPKINRDILEKELYPISIKNCKTDDDILKKILIAAWKKEKKNIKPEKIHEYEEAIYYETDIIKKCGMARYFILDNIIVKRAVNKYNAILTKSGRGSAVSFYINKLLGLTEVDRIKAPITLYPTRFMSAERILSSRSLPDIDLNFGSAKPVVKASKDILGEDGIYYMIAYKPLQDSSAFRLWCKAKGMNINDYDSVAKDIDDYRDNPKWKDLIEDSKKFKGVVESISPSPCSYLLLDKPISEEIGLIKVKEEMCCCLDGYNCDQYKYLKND